MNQRAEHQTNEPPDEQTTAENAAAAPPTQQRTMTSHSKLYYDKDTASLPSHRKLCMRRGMSTGLAVYVCSRYRDAASRPAQPALEVLAEEQPKLSKAVQVRYNEGTTYKSRRHTKAYEGVRRQPAYEGIRRHTKAYEGIRRHTKAYEGSPHTKAYKRRHTKEYEGIQIRRHTNRYNEGTTYKSLHLGRIQTNMHSLFSKHHNMHSCNQSGIRESAALCAAFLRSPQAPPVQHHPGRKHW